jgi:4-carboxymuconolactone decarboxylase
MSSLPPRYTRFRAQYPDVASAFETLGEVAGKAGPLDAKTRELVRLGLALGARLEGATHSHVRRALEAGCTPEEIRHAAVLGVTTLGFPATMMALSWVEDILEKGRVDR